MIDGSVKDASLHAGTLKLDVAEAPAVADAASVDVGSDEFFRRARQRLSFDIPAGLIGTDSTGKALPSQYLIFSEVSYLYQPIVGYVMAKAGVTLSDTAYTRPRQLSCVHYNELTSNPCPTIVN